MNCIYCNKELKNKNSKTQHEIRCKSNANSINDLIWTPERRKQHSEWLVEFRKTETKRRVGKISETGKLAIKQRNLLHNSSFWTDANRKAHSDIMKNVVINRPDSYSKNNVSGRVKLIDYNGIKLKGNWEVEVAKWLDELNIKWEHETKMFKYIWNDTQHIYFPDFYLPSLDIYIEVKGYETERDREKWKVVKNLFVIKSKEINLIRKNKLTIKDILRGSLRVRTQGS